MNVWFSEQRQEGTEEKLWKILAQATVHLRVELILIPRSSLILSSLQIGYLDKIVHIDSRGGLQRAGIYDPLGLLKKD